MKLVILRGTSGSGKSTKAKELVKAWSAGIAVVCSADAFFAADGKYEFDPTRLPAAHGHCRGMCEGAMMAKADLVIIDNTNTRRKEYEPYLKLAEKYGYVVEEIIVGAFDEKSLELYAKRNVHQVPLTTIQKMAARFEK